MSRPRSELTDFLQAGAMMALLTALMRGRGFSDDVASVGQAYSSMIRAATGDISELHEPRPGRASGRPVAPGYARFDSVTAGRPAAPTFEESMAALAAWRDDAEAGGLELLTVEAELDRELGLGPPAPSGRRARIRRSLYEALRGGGKLSTYAPRGLSEWLEVRE